MWIKRLKVQNFKSLVDFEMHLDKFTCLIGLNGSGKSSVLQFLDFLSYVVKNRVDIWLDERGWDKEELRSFGSESDVIKFGIEIDDGSEEGIVWSGDFSIDKLYCTHEELRIGEEVVTAKIESANHYFIRFSIESNGQKSSTRYNTNPEHTGSLLSIGVFIANEMINAEESRNLYYFFANTNSLELLDPSLMRLRTKGKKSSLGRGGKELISFLNKLAPDKKQILELSLKKVFGRFGDYSINETEGGTNQFLILEKFRKDIQTPENHINDGFLRTTAIFASLLTQDQILLIDEIENGFNLEITETIIDALVASPKQVIVTTHSPVVLNFLDKEQAQKSVVYLFRDDEGGCKSIRFFDIPSMKKKLTVLGPGEVLVDTLLTELDKEIKAQETRMS